MILKLKSDHFQTICTHAEQTYPQECCGLLLGRMGDGEKVLVELWQVENVWGPQTATIFSSESNSQDGLTRERRYTIDPQDMLKAQRYARDRQLAIVGIYHSHPNHPALPSECDRTLAWPEYSYIIVSVNQGKAGDLRSWQLDDDRQFQAEELKIEP